MKHFAVVALLMVTVLSCKFGDRRHSRDSVTIETDAGSVTITTDNRRPTPNNAPVYSYESVEVKPQFSYPGGTDTESSIKQLLADLKPESGDVQGRVIVEFTIEEDGSTSDIKVLRGLGPEIDKDAVTMTMAITPWTAGKMDGKPVRVKYVLPIVFK